MGTIATEQRQYFTYVLTQGDAHLEVVPERGGIITDWRVGDRALLYLDTERFTHPDLSIRGGVPILFPICGNLPDDTYIHDGRAYRLKQHGFARDLPWRVLDSVSDPAAPSLTIALESSEQTLAVYPFAFQLVFTYTLHDRRLEIRQCYHNRSAEVMPFSAGFHPYFPVADKSQLAIEIPGTEFYRKGAQLAEPFAGEFDFDQAEIDVAFLNVTQPVASVSDRAQGTHLTFRYSEPFSTLVFWTVKGKEFYCLEPWTAPRNAINTGTNLLYVEPGASLELMFALDVML